MKNHFFISMLAAVALLGGLTACNGKLDKAPRADQVPENAVRITASIGNPFTATRSMPLGTEEEQGKFNVGDEIFVSNQDREHTIYRFDGTVWVPKEGKYLLWKKAEDNFFVFYPAEAGLKALEGQTYEEPTDQSSKENIAKADIMTSSLTSVEKMKEALHFTMRRETARLIVEIAGFNPEFPGDAKVEDVRFNIKTNPDPSIPLKEYIPYAKGEGKKGSTYTVLVPHTLGGSTVSLTVGGKTMTAKLSSNYHFSGYSYTYRLTVGKEKLETTEVTVSDWTDSAVIPGGEAEAD